MKLPKAKKLRSGSWHTSVMVDGQRISVTGETEAAVNRRVAYLKGGGDKPDKGQRLTLSEAIDAHIELRGSQLSPATVRGYRGIQKHRFPALMTRDVRSITQADVQIAVNNEAKVVSAKTVANAYGMIASVLRRYGLALGKKDILLPQQVKPVKQYLQPDDIGKLAAAIEGDTCEVPILLAVWLGMRRSEIMGLCWDCVDTERSLIHVRRAVVPDSNHKMVLKDVPKNSMSQRTIDCPVYIMDKIKALPRRQDNRLFALYPSIITCHVHRACAAAGIVDTTLHGLRHTNAAVMKAVGVDDRLAMERGGWSSEATYRKTYSYVFDQNKTDATNAINDFFTHKLHTESVKSEE